VWKRPYLTRDAFIIFVALGLGIYEIVWGGARPAVLTFLASLILSPIVMKIDEQKRLAQKRQNNGSNVD